MANTWAIILAAGSSRRIGSQKLLLPFGKSTIIETVLDNVLNSHIDHVMVVLGPQKDEILQRIGHLPVQFCHNKEHEKGMRSSMICGIRALPADAVSALIFLGDQPGIPPSVTNRLIEAYNEELVGVVIPVHEHRRAYPLLMDMKYRKEMESLDLEEGFTALRHHFPEDVLELEVDEPEILLDIDTQEDYNKAKK